MQAKNTSPLALFLAGLLACPGLLTAQEKPKLGPRSFFPSEYTSEYFVDLDALQDTAVWDVIERNLALRVAFQQFKQSYGFHIRDILRVRSTARFVEGKAAGEFGDRSVAVTVIEGRRLALPSETPADGWSWLKCKKDEVAGHAVIREQPDQLDADYWVEPRIYVMPRAGLLVIGSETMLGSALSGKRRGGVIAAPLMALTAMRKPLAYSAVQVPQPDSSRYTAARMPVKLSMLTEDDPLQTVIARLSVDEATEKITLRATLRFKTGKAGPKFFREQWDAELAAMAVQPMFSAIKKLADLVTWKIDGADLLATVEFDRKSLSRTMEQTAVLPFVFLMSAVGPGVIVPAPVAIAIAAEEVEEEEEEEVEVVEEKATEAKEASKKAKKKASGKGEKK